MVTAAMKLKDTYSLEGNFFIKIMSLWSIYSRLTSILLMRAQSFQSCPTLLWPYELACQAPLSMEILQARILEWVALHSALFQGSLAYCSPWGCKELDMIEQLNWTGSLDFFCFHIWVEYWLLLGLQSGSFLTRTKPLGLLVLELANSLCKSWDTPVSIIVWINSWMLGAGALGRPRGMVRGGRREEGSEWGTRAYLW